MYRVCKRIFDMTFAFLGILVTLPIWLITIIGILVSDPGPIFYMANRVGKDNKTFKMFKFRSMRIAKHANENNFKADTDRIFPFGNLIRRLKIDELPQLLNILIGSMSIVGPRPASVDQVHIVRAGKYGVASNTQSGLTGPSALYDYIYGDDIQDEREYQEKVLPTRLALDVYYVNHMNFFYDIKMIWYTVVCIVCSIFKKKPNKFFNELLRCAETVDGATEEVGVKNV